MVLGNLYERLRTTILDEQALNSGARDLLGTFFRPIIYATLYFGIGMFQLCESLLSLWQIKVAATIFTVLWYIHLMKQLFGRPAQCGMTLAGTTAMD